MAPKMVFGDVCVNIFVLSSGVFILMYAVKKKALSGTIRPVI